MWGDTGRCGGGDLMNAIEDLLDIVTDDQRVEEGQDAWGAIVVVVHGQTLAGGVAELVADLREDRLGLGRLGGALATLCRRGLEGGVSSRGGGGGRGVGVAAADVQQLRGRCVQGLGPRLSGRCRGSASRVGATAEVAVSRVGGAVPLPVPWRPLPATSSPSPPCVDAPPPLPRG